MRAPRLRSGALLLALVCGATVPAYAQTPPQVAPPSSTQSAPTSTTASTPGTGPTNPQASSQQTGSQQTQGAGVESLVNARQAWDQGQYDTAELYYKTAIERGGLSPTEVVDAYVRLGSARAILKKATLARAAFRQVAAIDSHFKVPPEAGKKAAQVAALARHDEARVGSILLRAQVPQRVAADASFKVDATLDGKHTATVARVGVDVREPLSGKHYSDATVVARSTHFTVPSSVVVGGATLIVRVDALDAHDNRLATREVRVRVEESPVTAAAPAPIPLTPPPAATTPAVVAPIRAPALATSELPRDESHDRDTASSNHGFWSTAWPYVIGVVALAGAGVATYVYTRPTEDVSISSARVNAR